MKLVIFTKNTARLFDNVEDYKEVMGWPNAMLNPNLLGVGKTPPHFWLIKNGIIAPMNWYQKLIRSRDIRKRGMDMRIIKLEREELDTLISRKYDFMAYSAMASAILNILLLLYAVGHRL